MIDWHPISSPPPMVEVDDTPLQLAGKPVPAIRRSEPVLLAIEHPATKQRRIMVGRVCFADGHEHPFDRVHGRGIVAWAPIHWPNSPAEGTT